MQLQHTRTAMGRPLTRPAALEIAVTSDLLSEPSVTTARLLLCAISPPLVMHFLVILDGDLDQSTLTRLSARWQAHAPQVDAVRIVLRGQLSRKDQLLLGTYEPFYERPIALRANAHLLKAA